MSKENNYVNNQYQSFFENSLLEIDPDIHKAINDELKRQQSHIELNCIRKYSFTSST